MEIVKLVPNPCNSEKNLENLCNYIIRPDRAGNSGRYVFGRGVDPYDAFREFSEMQELFGKASGRRAYHLIVSLPKQHGYTEEDMLDVSLRIMDLFYPKYQIMGAVHVEQDNLHSHFVINPVPMEVGNNRKLEMDYALMHRLSNIIDEIVKEIE